MPDSPLLPLIGAGPTTAVLRLAAPAAVELPAVRGVLAGASEVDITPPPGLPKAGHSRNAHDGTGFRTRLRARVLHLRGGTTSLAIVACDLHAGSGVVQRLVADAVARTTDIPLAGLFIGATHTHAGPGQYLGSDFYNRFASNRPGFDPGFTHFLVTRITEAVGDAYRTRRPARLAAGRTEVWGYTRNRSLDAHVRNGSVSDHRVAPQRRYRAIDPRLHLLRVDVTAPDGGTDPLAALVVFSVHGTGISRHDRSYNADVWAYLTGGLGDHIRAVTGRSAVVGAIEGAHGDMTPAVRPGMLVYPEAERVGTGIGRHAAELYDRLEPGLSDDVHLAAGFREVDLAVGPVIDGIRLPPPALGAAKLAGARENGTPLLGRIPPFRPGHPKPPVLQRSPQGPKWVFPSRSLQTRIAPPESFPQVLPFQLLRIGSLDILGVPFEVTVEAGRRLAASVAAAGAEPGVGRAGANDVVVSSVANDYCDYLTTPEEYALQCYEGASTLYGPDQLAFVAAAARALAGDLRRSGSVDRPLPVRTFHLRTADYLLRPGGRPVARAVVGPARFVEASAAEDACWEVEWSDVAPGDLHWHEPLVRVDVLGRAAGGAPGAGGADDQGWHVGVAHLGRDRHHGHRYRARWYAPPVGDPPPHRFVLLANAGQPEVAGQPFD